MHCVTALPSLHASIHFFVLCSPVKSWNSVIYNGSWDVANNTAGGCRNYPTFVKNPQYVVELSEDDDGDGKCSVLVALMQKHRRKQKKMGVQELCIGFSIYKVSEQKHHFGFSLSMYM